MRQSAMLCLGVLIGMSVQDTMAFFIPEITFTYPPYAYLILSVAILIFTLLEFGRRDR